MNIEWNYFPLPPIPLIDSMIKLLMPDSAGIYLLCSRAANIIWICWYVGKCDNLKERLSEHLKPSEPNLCIKWNIYDKRINTIAYAEVGGETVRDGIEKFLYDYYSPKCNVKDPGGNPIPVNLP